MLINLLPDSQKEIIKQEKTKIKIWTILLCLVFGLFCFTFFLLFLNYLALAQINDLSQKIDWQNNPQNQEKFQKLKITIDNLNKDLAFSQQNFSNRVFFSDFLTQLVKITPNDIYFTKINLQKSSRQVLKDETSQEKVTQFFAKVELSGLSKTREGLYDFRNILLSQKDWLENPSFLPISWKLPINSEFSLGLNYLQPN